ncbi:MAG: hypothetical protein RLY86_4390, partial [Pseudomonadota bacterium]
RADGPANRLPAPGLSLPHPPQVR